MTKKKFYLTPDEADEYVRLRLTIEAFKVARDRYMKKLLYDIRFMKGVCIDFYETETPPSMPGMPDLEPIYQSSPTEEQE